MSVATKSDFMRLSRAGRLGNALEVWDHQTQVPGRRTVTIRSRRKDSPHFVPYVSSDYLGEAIFELQVSGARLEDLYFQEVPPAGTERLINGEIMRDAGGYYLTYGTSSGLSLRHDLERNGKTVKGLRAAEAVKTLGGQEAWDALQEIWDEHPTSIIEFTVFKRAVGVRHRRTVIWEVRDY